MYTAPSSPGLRAPLSSAQIRTEFGLIANEFASMPASLGGSDRGFSGGRWNGGTLYDATLHFPFLGTFTAPGKAFLEYAVFVGVERNDLGVGGVGFVRNLDGRLKIYDATKVKCFWDSAHNFVMGDGIEMATNTSGGFGYITTLNGQPSGTPAAYEGAAPIMYDRAGNRIGIYEAGNGWKFTEPMGSFTNWGSKTYDPGSLSDGAGVTTTVTVSGATTGMWTRESFSVALAGVKMWSWVSAADTVSVRLENHTGSPVDLAEGTLKVSVFNAP
jgi:hypothetical protein